MLSFRTSLALIVCLLFSLQLTPCWAAIITCNTVSDCPRCRDKQHKIDPNLRLSCDKFACTCMPKKDKNKPSNRSTNANPEVTIPTEPN